MSAALRILIVEDEAITAIMLAETLRDRGYGVGRPVATGPDAVAAARRTPPDIVLMDINLAGAMDGIQAAGIIRAEHPHTAFIFMTGYADTGDGDGLARFNPLERLIKPVSTEAVDAVIREYCRSQHGPDRP